MEIISKDWCKDQNCYIYEFICNDAATLSTLPTTDIAYGSSCVCGDGTIYFFFPDNTWKEMA